MMNQSAQGLASLGRGNDTMLMHVTPREVEGLQGLAMAHGGSLTINPQTGLPEAGFFDAILPMAAGFALGPGGFGLFSGANAALMTGLTVGGLTALGTGDLGKGLMAGFGAYGGSGLGEAVKNFGSQAAIPGAAPTSEVMKEAISANQMSALQPTGAPGVNVFSGAGAPGVKLTGATQPYSGITGSTGQVGANLGSTMPRAAVDTGGLDALSTDVLSGSNFGKLDYSLGTNTAAPQTLSQGFSNVLDSPLKFAEEYGPGKLALQGGSLALSAFEPPMPQPYLDPDKGKYRGPQGQLNLGDQFDTGLRLATGGTIQSGGIRDLYGTPDNQPTISPGLSGFGLGRLNSLAGEQAMTQAQTLGYADGGDVVAGERGMNLDKQRALNLDLVPSLNVETGKQNYTTPESFMYNFYTGNIPSDSLGPLGQLYSYTMKGKLNDGSTVGQNLYDDMMKSRTKMAKGGYLNGQGDGMSDSIPATIEGKQPARLADGEFVVPADVVSHIGNGSSKAGSKRLYAMLDKIRHARTGNKKQGKQINPSKYMPA
jgi:hypothetical protein